VTALWSKADTAAASARILFDAGDYDGAVNRAYYAMFTAARAALAIIDPELARSKKHSTIIGRFGLHFVKNGKIEMQHARHFSVALDMRLMADYSTSSVFEAEARRIIVLMSRFIEGLAPIQNGSQT
jgi:uncharacterized protein (UPF0332 family)